MLQAIRDRAQGIFAWVMLILVGVPFALWGIQNYLDSGKEQPLAVVGDRDIFEREVNQAYQQSLANLVGLAEVDDRQLKHEALERLIREEIIAQNAEAKDSRRSLVFKPKASLIRKKTTSCCHLRA
ncbi:MAG: SurA N-terminal domain-containing protein [Methylocaldum sp.]|nr:SurA N-terminal domain-containing protein [Methylocaldum sp.]